MRLAWASALLCLFVSGLSAQGFSVGVKAGYPLTYTSNSVTNVDVTLNTNSQTFIVGGTAEVSLPFGLAVEGDLLYHPYKTSQTGPLVSSSTYNSIFEVPVLAKLRLGKGIAKPFVDAGPDFRFRPTALALSHEGFDVGGGIEFKLLLLKVAPEIRYTRWASSSELGNNPNEVSLLLGVTF